MLSTGNQNSIKTKCATPCLETNAYAACAVEKNRVEALTRGPERLERTKRRGPTRGTCTEMENKIDGQQKAQDGKKM